MHFATLQHDHWLGYKVPWSRITFSAETTKCSRVWLLLKLKKGPMMKFPASATPRHPIKVYAAVVQWKNPPATLKIKTSVNCNNSQNTQIKITVCWSYSAVLIGHKSDQILWTPMFRSSNDQTAIKMRQVVLIPISMSSTDTQVYPSTTCNTSQNTLAWSLCVGADYEAWHQALQTTKHEVAGQLARELSCIQTHL